MAEANTLRPIVMSSSAPPETLGRRGRFGLLGTAAWICLVGMSAQQPLLHTARAGASAPCQVQQKTPLYVGFGNEVGLDRFEETALESRDIIREIKHWACDDGTNTSLAVPSLQLAFARRHPIRLDLLQFDDPEFARAYAVLSGSNANNTRVHWRIDLAQSDQGGWTVARTGIARASDLTDR